MPATPHAPNHATSHAGQAPSAALPATPIGPYRHERALHLMLASLAIVFWLLLTVLTVGVVWIYLGLIWVVGLFSHSALITHLKGSAVRIDADQFPDLHARLLACCRRIGLDRVPETYLMAGNGALDAFATRFLRRYYVVLLSDIVGALEDDPEALNFYIGHELCHVARPHIAHGWWLAPAMILPLVGSAYRRAQEYSCDQHGLACCADPASATQALSVLAAGPTQWRTMNAEAYLRQCDATDGFWMSLNELTSDYPWLCKRMRHLMPQAPVDIPSRHPLAWSFALFIPRLGMTGLVGGLLFLGAIVGVGAAIGIAAYQDYRTRVAYAPVFSYGAELTTRLSRYYAERQELPPDLAEIGADPSKTGLPVQEITLDQDNGELRLVLADERSIVFVPSLDENSQVIWSCMTDLPRGTIPPRSGCKTAAGSKIDRLEGLLEQAR